MMKFVFALVVLFLISCSGGSHTVQRQNFSVAHPKLDRLTLGNDSIALIPIEHIALDLQVQSDCTVGDSLYVQERCIEISESLLAFQFNAQLYKLADSLSAQTAPREIVPGVDRVPAHDTELDRLLLLLQGEYPLEYFRKVYGGRYVANEPVSSAVRSVITQIAARYRLHLVIIPIHVVHTIQVENKQSASSKYEVLISIWSGADAELLYLYYGNAAEVLLGVDVDTGLYDSLFNEIRTDIFSSF